MMHSLKPTRFQSAGLSRPLRGAALSASLLLGASWALAQNAGVPADVAPEASLDEATQELLIVTEAPPVMIELRAEPRDASQPLTREEVLADLNLWRRAGLAEPLGESSPDPVLQAQRLALYEAWRQGSAFYQELERVTAQRSGIAVPEAASGD